LFDRSAFKWVVTIAIKLPIHESEVAPEVWYENTDREIFGRALCDIGGKAKVGVGLMDLPPGSNTRRAHYHTLEEEHLYIIDGLVTLHLGDRRFSLTPGSYVCFPAGQPQAHYLENESSGVCRYLIVGERIAQDEVVYPSE
jgi:uncharacterized cupin superfamily protein